jgi:hypothetical protein
VDPNAELTKNVEIQNTHLHDKPATTTYPATVGPKAGPAKGARVNIAKAFPRVLASQMSEMRALQVTSEPDMECDWDYAYPTLANGAAANVPPRNRIMRIEGPL